MGLLDKLLKKGPKASEVTKGGSPVYRYEETEHEAWRPPQAYGEYAEEISGHFKALFPKREEFVYHELISDLVHIDVNIMRPTEERPYYVMYTTGMSDMPMTLPEEIADREDLKHAELFMFLPGEWNPGETGQLDSDIPDSEYWPIRLIKYLARFPHESVSYTHLVRLAGQPDLFTGTLDTRRKAGIFEGFYGMTNGLEIKGNLYIDVYKRQGPDRG